MTKSAIEWCDENWSPIVGCSHASAGCEHCYAERLAATRLRHIPAYEGLARMTADGPRWNRSACPRLIPERLREPARWRKPRRVFVCGMGDLFHERASDYDIAQVFGAMNTASPAHTFMVLTKRASRMRRFVIEHEGSAGPRSNIWLGVSVENRAAANERIPELLDTPAAVRWVSYEPALGPVDWATFLSPVWHGEGWRNVDWLVCGAETGHGARPMADDWARMARNAAAVRDVPFFFKRDSDGNGTLDGVVHHEWPVAR